MPGGKKGDHLSISFSRKKESLPARSYVPKLDVKNEITGTKSEVQPMNEETGELSNGIDNHLADHAGVYTETSLSGCANFKPSVPDTSYPIRTFAMVKVKHDGNGDRHFLNQSRNHCGNRFKSAQIIDEPI